MSNLKELKKRIGSVKSTQKITKAMQMVAASKLRRAQQFAEAARPYAENMNKMLQSLTAGIGDPSMAPTLMVGNGKSDTHLLIIITSDRGLCGAFNSSIVKELKQTVQSLQEKKKKVKLLCIGKKGHDQLKINYSDLIIDSITGLSKKGRLSYQDAEAVSEQVINMFEAGEFDVCSILYNEFVSVIQKNVKNQQIIPLETKDSKAANDDQPQDVFDFEPEEKEILSVLLPRNIGVQIYHALLESGASEQASRMMAMDNATRNAGDMIRDLSLVYNRTRQAVITRELIEIISGAEAL